MAEYYVNAVRLYLNRVGEDTTGLVRVYLHDPSAGANVGMNDAAIAGPVVLAFSDMPQGVAAWYTFTFDSPVQITETGWLGIRVQTVTLFNNQIRTYAASDWVEAGDAPYDGQEQGCEKTGTTWFFPVGYDYAYQVDATGLTGNNAVTAAGSIDDYGLSGEFGVRSYHELPAPTKATNPTPANDSGPGIDFSNFTLSWSDGGGATSYDVYLGTTGNPTLVSEGQAGTSYVTDLAELETIFNASPINQVVYWRVDSVNEIGTTTGDEWHFDPRPAKATIVAPTHESSDIILSQVLEWS